jgi:hypothetical protein
MKKTCKHYKEYRGLRRPKCGCYDCMLMWVKESPENATKYILSLRKWQRDAMELSELGLY